MATMDMTLETLAAREAIRETKYRYFRAIDCKDFSLIEDVFTEDVSIDYGPMGVFKGRDTFLAQLKPLNTEPGEVFSSASGIHHALNPEIEMLSPERATCRWCTYFVSYDGEKHGYLQQSGHYEDELRVEAGRWKIASSIYTLWFHQGHTVGSWTPLFPNGPSRFERAPGVRRK